MTRFETVTATLEHALYVGERLRAAEVAEVWAMSKLSPLEAARRSFARSEYAWAWRVNGEPAAIWGVGSASLLGEIGCPWLLTSDLVDRYPISFLRRCGRTLHDVRATYQVLENWVDARHAVCLKWLLWMGFTVHPAAPFGVLGLPFNRVELRSPS